MWNVYQVYVPHNGDGEYPALYFIVVDNVNLTYDNDNGDWLLYSNDLSKYANFYINDAISNLG